MYKEFLKLQHNAPIKNVFDSSLHYHENYMLKKIYEDEYLFQKQEWINENPLIYQAIIDAPNEGS